MSTYGRMVIERPWQEIAAATLAFFAADGLIPVEAAKNDDLLLSESGISVALDSADLFDFVWIEPKLLASLSAKLETRITAISVQSTSGCYGLLVVDRGEIIRYVVEGPGGDTDGIIVNAGVLPEWDERIKQSAWNAADDMVGFLPWRPEPTLIGRGFRYVAERLGLLTPRPREEIPTDRYGQQIRPELRFKKPHAAISLAGYHERRSAESERKQFVAQFECERINGINGDGEILTVRAEDDFKLLPHSFKPGAVLIAVNAKFMPDPFRPGNVVTAVDEKKMILMPFATTFANLESWLRENNIDPATKSSRLSR